jgi:hypothetical protein
MAKITVENDYDLVLKQLMVSAEEADQLTFTGCILSAWLQAAACGRLEQFEGLVDNSLCLPPGYIRTLAYGEVVPNHGMQLIVRVVCKQALERIKGELHDIAANALIAAAAHVPSETPKVDDALRKAVAAAGTMNLMVRCKPGVTARQGASYARALGLTPTFDAGDSEDPIVIIPVTPESLEKLNVEWIGRIFPDLQMAPFEPPFAGPHG